MFQDFLRKRLEELDLNQSDLANALTLRGQATSKQAVSHWINGRYTPPLKSAHFRSALAASLEMDVNQLLKEIGFAVDDSVRSPQALRAADIVDQLPEEAKGIALEQLEVLQRHYPKTR